MSSVMHPQGPQPENTYWKRRIALVIGALVAIGLLGWALSSLFGGDSSSSTVQATPQNAPSLAVDPALASASATPTPSASATPTPSASATPSASGSSTPSASASTTPSHPATPSVSPSASQKPTPTPASTADCSSAPMRLAIGGSHSPAIGSAEAFTVTLTNAGSAPCKLALAPKALSLRVTSGSDAIWSSDDCAAWGASIPAQQLAPGKSVTWKPVWHTVRSTGTCTASSEELRSGTYVAKATLGSSAARLVMQLHH